MTFNDGDLYERSFDTPTGRVEVLAEIAVSGSRIELRDIAVYPSGADRLSISLENALAWVRLALAELAVAGFEEVRVTGTRLSGARPGRRVDVVIQLQRDHP
jgi:hypothetical protein